MIIAANLKTNFTRAQTSKYVNEVERFLQTNNICEDVLVFPAASSLNTHNGKITLGAQNAYATKNGAFTGEIGLDHLDEFGIKTILIGHSERRHILGETQKMIAEKFHFYKEQGFRIVYCIGESLQMREAGNDVMMEFLSSQLEGIDLEYEKLILAYEPVWAIGTGLTPTLEDITSLHLQLKKKCSAPLLYGGSVKVTNAKEVLALDGVDGILVGSAALYAEHFCTMCEYAHNLDK